MEKQEVFNGRIVSLALETATLPNGKRTTFEVVHHPGGAAVVALDDEQRVCLLRQYRHAMNGWVWELPAGKIDNREAPLITAQRELQEEAGIVADRWTALGGVVSSPGVFTEVVHLFLAQMLSVVAAANEEHELIEVHWLPLTEALMRAACSDINDGKTVAGLFRAHYQLTLPAA
ncbi:MAG: NUDIX hydrolase [Gammaproteobacteria bacterium]|nr:NUDIX hydrolase [Gammaproteobacteria bacterium]